MTLLPPDIERSYRDAAERSAARNLLARRDSLLRTIEQLAGTPSKRWSSAAYAAFPKSTNGVPDLPPARLARWVNIFAEELEEVHQLASRHVLDDAELRRALYFAGRLLATVTDLSIDVVDGFDLDVGTGR